MTLYRSPDYQISFETIGLSIQEKKFNIDFQDGGHLGLPIRMILATFYLQVTLILPIRVNWPFGSNKKKFKIDFHHGCYGDHLGFPIRMILD